MMDDGAAKMTAQPNGGTAQRPMAGPAQKVTENLAEMTIVQILGVPDSAETNRLWSNVVRALDALGVKASVDIVQSIDLFIQHKINGIPALIVNGNVVLQKHVPSEDELKLLLKMLDLNKSKAIAMKKIIVPTDFSEVAVSAYQYAIEMAAHQSAALQVVHVHYPEMSPETTYQMEPNQYLIDSKDRMLASFVVEGKAAVPVTKSLRIGFPVEEIVGAAQEAHADLIVMGTTGEHGLIDRWFGSVSSNVAQKAGCPVLLVPPGVRFKDYDRILYASNFESTNEEMLHRLVNFALLFKADIHFVHVEGDDATNGYKEVENKLFNILFKDKEPPFSFTMSQVEGRSVADGLNDYALKHQIDLSVIVSPHRSFWDSLFHKSVTKALALNTSIPLMVLH